MNDALTIIVAPPPTPNGDLHVGHISGPYLGADVLRRYLALRNRPVISALSVDLNQSYVVTTADRLGDSPMHLATRSHTEISSSLASAGINFDVVGMPDAAYSQYVTDWFRRLFDASKLKLQQRAIPYDVLRKRHMFESYASGFCPVCVSATKANICETCGHPNDAQNLLSLTPTGGRTDDPVRMSECTEYFIDLEDYRGQIEAYLHCRVPELRPALKRLTSELLASRLPLFPVTFPSSWGLPAPFPDADGLVLNVWAEMVPGHYHWINRATSSHATLNSMEAKKQYVQYLGFDNSFFYVFAHLGLAFAAADAGIEALLPVAFITNEFYLLDNFKFSTSQGHLIWARDLLSDYPSDEVRFYLAWSNPEFNQANFSRNDLDRVLEHKLRQPLKRIFDCLGGLSWAGSRESAHARAMLRRFEVAYDFRNPSLRIAALTVSNGFDLFESLHARGEAPGTLLGIARAIACGLAPIAQDTADRLWRATGATGPICWPASS